MILDWVPPEYVTKRITMSALGVPRFVVTTELLERGPDQTDLVYRVSQPRPVVPAGHPLIAAARHVGTCLGD